MAIKMADIVARVTSQTQYSSLLAGDQFGFKSAKQYGAVGDGVTDDSAAILSLISAVSASTAKALYFPTGIYKVDNVTLTSTHFSGYYLFGDNASFIGITKDIDQVGQTVGKLSDLNTADKDSIVDAINELEAESVAGVLTTRGDIISHDSTGTIRVAIGTPLQYIVAGNTSDTTPLTYLDSPQKILTNQGDILYASAANTPTRLAIGTNLQNLSVNATTNGFSYIDSPQKVMTNIGDLLYSTAPNTIGRLGIGTNLQVLGVNASTNGLSYIDSVQKIMTTAGDMIYASAANNPVRLPIGTSGKSLTVSGTTIAWDYVIPGNYTASDNVLASSTAEVLFNTPTNVYTMVKSFRVAASGSFRVTLDLRVRFTGDTANAKFFKNGSTASELASSVTMTSTVYTAYSRDISGISIGDTVEVWCMAEGPTGDQGYIQNTQIKATLGAGGTIVVA